MTNDLTGLTVGRFAIGARLGAGGMGQVYRAEDTQLKRTVAIKRLARGSGEYTRANELLKEAQKASALNHPKIAGVYDVFTEGNELFLVMEYVDGTTLRERMESPISVPEFLNIAVQCVEALGAAHEKGILHGDLKPANIMITRGRSEVKVCDFGVARHVSQSSLSSDDTATTLRGGIAGTPAYMAPEIILERPIDLSADIFSLGVVFYEMLAGSNPFYHQTLIATVDRIRTHSPEPLDRVNSEVPPKLARIIARMIEKEPQNRYATVADLRRDLITVQTKVGVRRERSFLERHRRLVLSVSALIAFIAIASSLLNKWRMSTPSMQPLPAEIDLAVLPFSITGADSIKQFFGQGLVETLNTQLSRLTVNRHLQVASAADVRARNVKSAREAREQLGANLALGGAIRYSGDNVQITSVLIDTRSGRVARSETVTADTSNVLDAEQRVADAVVRMLGVSLTPEERSALNGRETLQPRAYDFYLQGRGYLLNFDRSENLDSAITVFRKALATDPRYALAYAGLGEAYWRKEELTKATIWLEPARSNCEGALAIDPGLAEPHACLGMILNGTGEYDKAAGEFNLAVNREPTNDFYYAGLATAYEKLNRAPEAEQTYRRAIELRPHYWAAYNNLGTYFYRSGKYGDAISMFEQATSLAPDSLRGYSNLGAAYFMKDRIPDAIAAFEKSFTIKPNYAAASNLGTLYFFQGDYKRSAEDFRKALSLGQENYQVWGNLAGALNFAGDTEQSLAAFRRARELVEQRLRVNPKDSALQMALADYNAALGDMDKARQSFDKVVKPAPTDSHLLFQISVFYEFRLGQRDAALSWLSKAVEHGQTWREIDNSPALRDLRKDPRFQQLRHKEG